MDQKDKMEDQAGTSSSSYIDLQSFLYSPKTLHPPTSTKKIKSSSKETFHMDTFRQLQRSQWQEHESHYLKNENLSEGCVFMQRTRKYHRRARSADVNLALKLCIENSRSWAAKFPLLYENLTEEQRKWIFAEYSIGFMIIDQALRTKNDADDGFWLLQNGSFLGLHPGFKFEILEGKDKEKQEELDKAHFNFVTQLVNTIIKPFKTLQVNLFECIMLKNLLFFTYCTIFFESNPYYSHCMDLFAQRTTEKRLGETVLLIRSIRCAIISFYNIMKQSELFSIANFDQVVKDVLAE